MAQTSDFNDGSMMRADVSDMLEVMRAFIEEMITEYHGRIRALHWRHVR